MDDFQPPKPKRRWYQFSVRTLLIVVLLVACGLSWFAWMRERARRQQRAVKAIRESRGTVWHEESSWPEWLHSVLGDDFLLDVHTVYGHSAFGDEAMAHLASLSGLQKFSMSRNQQVTDAGLVHLKTLTGLEELYLVGPDITDAGMVHLKGLTRLQTLSLTDTGVTGSGLEHLQRLENLEALTLSGPNVTDATLEHVARLTNLGERKTSISGKRLSLHLGQTQVTGGGLERLVRVRPGLRIYTPYGDRYGDGWGSHSDFSVNLTILEGQTSLRRVDLTRGIRGPDITDKGLVHLKQLVHLEELSFHSNEVTDAALVNLEGMTKLKKLSITHTPNIVGPGLVHLQAMTALEILDLHGTGISDAALMHLAELPNLKELRLGDTEVTGSGLVHLSELKNLKVLSLYGNARFGDAGLENMKALPQLTELDLRHTLVTDDGLLHLTGLSNLKELTLGVDAPQPADPAREESLPRPGWTTTSPITDEGVKKLQEALPDCEIRH